MKNRIGIPQDKAADLAQDLNVLLANYQLYYQNLRGFHWNIKGPQFFELHVKFEELYNEAQLAIDEIAERVLTLGHQPLHTFSDYLAHSQIKEARDKSGSEETVEGVLSGLKTLIEQERKILTAASEVDDEGTVDLMTGYLSAQEKLTWMLASYLGRA